MQCRTHLTCPSLHPQDGVNFSVYSSSATSVSLCLFTESDLQAGKVTCEVALSPQLNRTGYTWHILLPKLDTSLLYGAKPSSPLHILWYEAWGTLGRNACIVQECKPCVAVAS